MRLSLKFPWPRRVAKERDDALTLSDGNRGQGPPDLEEIWQNFNRRLNSLFRRRNFSGGGAGGPDGRHDSVRALWIGIAGAIALGWLASGLYQVPAGSAGVVLRFGRYVTTTGPGQGWHMPWPIESVETVDLSGSKSVTIDGTELAVGAKVRGSAMLTGDENIVDVRFSVQYRIKNAQEFKFNNEDPEGTVKQAAETAVREIVGRNTMDFAISAGREKIAFELNESIQRILDLYKTGILVTGVAVQSVQPPDQVQAAFDDAVKASQDAERSKNEGQAYANDVIPRARGDAARLILQAEGYRASVVATAEGDAARFKKVLAEYSKAPQVTRDRMYLQTMQDVFTNTTKVLIDTHGSNNLLYLPLDKLIERSREQAASTAAPATGAAVQPPSANGNPTDDSRSRDPVRSRERDTR